MANETSTSLKTTKTKSKTRAADDVKISSSVGTASGKVKDALGKEGGLFGLCGATGAKANELLADSITQLISNNMFLPFSVNRVPDSAKVFAIETTCTQKDYSYFNREYLENMMKDFVLQYFDDVELWKPTATDAQKQALAKIYSDAMFAPAVNTDGTPKTPVGENFLKMVKIQTMFERPQKLVFSEGVYPNLKDIVSFVQSKVHAHVNLTSPYASTGTSKTDRRVRFGLFDSFDFTIDNVPFFVEDLKQSIVWIEKYQKMGKYMTPEEIEEYTLMIRNAMVENWDDYIKNTGTLPIPKSTTGLDVVIVGPTGFNVMSYIKINDVYHIVKTHEYHTDSASTPWMSGDVYMAIVNDSMKDYGSMGLFFLSAILFLVFLLGGIGTPVSAAAFPEGDFPLDIPASWTEEQSQQVIMGFWVDYIGKVLAEAYKASPTVTNTLLTNSTEILPKILHSFSPQQRASFSQMIQTMTVDENRNNITVIDTLIERDLAIIASVIDQIVAGTLPLDMSGLEVFGGDSLSTSSTQGTTP